MAEHGDPLSASTWSERWRGTGQVLRLVVGAAPVRATLTAVSVLPNFVSSPLVTLCLGAIVNAVVRQDVRAGVVAAAGIGAIQILANSLGLASFRSRMHLREISGRALSMRMAEAISSIPGIEHLEQPAIADRIELLRNARQQLAGILDAFMISLGRLALVVVTMAALVRISPWFVLLAVAGVPTVVAGARNARRQADLTERQTPDGRRLSHLREVLDTPGPAGEVRVFGLAPELMGRHDRLWRARERDTARLSRRNQLLESGAWLVFAAAYVGALVLILRRAFAGSVTAGDVAVAAGLGATVRGMLESSVGTATWLVDTMRTAARFAWMTDLAAGGASETAIGAAVEVPATLTHGIDLIGVGFRYPGTDVDVLREVDLHLPAGATVAIVGDNGAGKSTLVKLLARFYEPTEGAILVDGVPLRSMAIELWRERLSAGFQDHLALHLSAREAIAFGRHEVLLDDPDARDAAVLAAADRAGSGAVVTDLPAGLDQQLGTAFPDGIEMSGGQWQKVALSRAMMRPAPLVLLLDEPTAALDARAEHDLFERFAGAAGDAARAAGGITLLVSHRFSTVRMADLILVVDGGTIAASGTHAELMAAGGLYAELYELQARAYR